MSAVPAPVLFQVLRDYLEAQQIDVAHICFHLECFLQKPEHLPKTDWYTDPLDEHQAWDYRKTIGEFIEMLQKQPDEGDGDDD